MNFDYDVFVIGSGPGGGQVAERCAQAGKRVAVADEQFGGTCALRGCTPKKAMEALSSLWWKARALGGHGFPPIDAPLVWKDLIAHVQSFTTLVPAHTKWSFEQNGINVVESAVAFHDAHTLVALDQDERWTAEHIIIATGAHPRPLSFPGHELVDTHESLFILDELPAELAFVGGGFVSFEMAHIAAACGAKVTIISEAQQPLDDFDYEMSSQLVQATLDKGIDVRLGHRATAISSENGRLRVVTERLADGQEVTLSVHMAIHGAGRVPRLSALQLERAGISASDEEGIQVGGNLQCEGAEHIYAIGDVIGRRPFTPAASYEAEIVAYNLSHQRKKRPIYRGLPTVLYTHPKLAGVGQTERELQAAGVKYERIRRELTDDLIEKSYHNAFAGYKVLLDRDDKTILGAQVISSRAEEIINILGLAMQADIEATELAETLFAYPSAGQAAKYMVQT